MHPLVQSFIEWWQYLPQHISPVFFSIGSFPIRYYSLMFFLSFAVAYLLIFYRFKKESTPYTGVVIENFFMWAILGVLLGGRLGYVLFYDLEYFVAYPLEIILPFDMQNGFHFTGISGMSYHGGLIGAFLAVWFVCKKNRLSFLGFADFIIPAIPAGYMFGRLGNFLNGELYGRITSGWWGMYFPQDLTSELRHPSQLYEAFFEGFLLFIILWSLRKKKIFDGFLFSLYLIGYGAVRFTIEFVREPDLHLGFVWKSFSMGQILCFVMIVVGIFLFATKFKTRKNSSS